MSLHPFKHDVEEDYLYLKSYVCADRKTHCGLNDHGQRKRTDYVHDGVAALATGAKYSSNSA